MIVIGLTGYAEHGKSTVADHLVAAHGFTKLSFAGPLKKMLRTLNPIVGLSNREQGLYPLRLSDLFDIYEGSEARIKAGSWGPEYRRLMQTLATDCVRAEDEDFWVRAALAQLDDPGARYVFDDVRFPNEAESVKSFPSEMWPVRSALWHVHRPNHKTDTRAHESEEHAGNLGEDHRLWNLHSMGYLLAQVEASLRVLLQ